MYVIKFILMMNFLKKREVKLFRQTCMEENPEALPLFTFCNVLEKRSGKEDTNLSGLETE